MEKMRNKLQYIIPVQTGLLLSNRFNKCTKNNINQTQPLYNVKKVAIRSGNFLSLDKNQKNNGKKEKGPEICAETPG